ncbi:glycosyltransferase family 34 protein [Cercospora zeae-maydis SCOH1-5]|uniref:Glycosyltransferase family 34 protein n=1 Tax=Cercospora zeae-maydis SCOH1-5 TaxID=717836 RepID=A0A6A6FUK3_9PEZI|nr:glycosyltransferase family 34 protein [Cercospora zeae-maydis SCOH1-5]
MLYGDLANDIRYKAALHSQRQHAERHGHGLKVRSIGFKSEFWSKYSFLLKIMLEELEKPKHWRTQWLCWVGYDVVLTNAYVPLDIFLPPGKNFSHVNALVTRDWTGLSSDVFFLRVNEWSTRYLSSVMSFYENQPDLQLQNGSDRRAQQYVSSHVSCAVQIRRCEHESHEYLTDSLSKQNNASPSTLV